MCYYTLHAACPVMQPFSSNLSGPTQTPVLLNVQGMSRLWVITSGLKNWFAPDSTALKRPIAPRTYLERVIKTGRNHYTDNDNFHTNNYLIYRTVALTFKTNVFTQAHSCYCNVQLSELYQQPKRLANWPYRETNCHLSFWPLQKNVYQKEYKLKTISL